MKDLALHPEANAEMIEVARYYEDRSPGLGAIFLDEVEKVFLRIREAPQSWPIVRGPYRRCLLHKFPLGVIYRVDPDRIFVMAVANLRRKPHYWIPRE